MHYLHLKQMCPFLVVVILLTFISSASTVFADEQCQAFGNGHDVYPRELKSDGYHRLHWSKAQSKSFSGFPSFPI